VIGVNQHPGSLQALEEEVVACRLCPRLVAWREQVACEKRRAYKDWTYWGKPVPGFGDPEARLLIVGLAPGAHGSNRTGRMFTGDSSGDTLYPALFRAGFASQTQARDREDGLTLQDAFITALARCAPPKNRPTADEFDKCRPYLRSEMALLPTVRVVLALGQLAFEGVQRAWREDGHAFPRIHFTHGAWHDPGAGLPVLAASYHPSRQNTNTGRLTEAMLDEVLARVKMHLYDRGDAHE
jgi:uracil-DNA glycosylase family 4